MHLSSNISHWICFLAGLYLVLTGVLLRDVVAEQLPLVAPAGHRTGRRKMAGVGRRLAIIAVGLVAVVYGIARILP